jgi:acylphosphatase
MSILDLFLGKGKKKADIVCGNDYNTVPKGMEPVFQLLGIDPTSHMHNSYAADILKKYGDRVVNVLKKIPVGYIRSNTGSIWNSIDEYGPEIVDAIIEQENLLGNPTRFNRLTTYCKYGPDMVHEIIEKENLSGRLDEYIPLEDYCKVWGSLTQLGEPEKDIVHFRLNFFGHVQDVGFRGTARSYARILGLEATAENLDNGSVECLVHGPSSRIEAFKKELKKEFRVSKIDESPLKDGI